MVARLVSARSARLAGAASTVLLLVGAQLIGFVGSASAASTFNAVDYAQCSNDQPPSTALDCPGDWINGILNDNNSHYAEDQVTPQRLQVTFDTGGTHSVTLSYLARKGTHHAYDSLATWNHTQTGADRCQDLPTGASCVGGSASTLAIPSDPTAVPAAGPTISDVTSGHQLSGQVFTLYGGTLTNATTPSHDNASNPTQDDYASITVSFDVTSTDHTVQLLFGGHLATSVGPRGWGIGLGSSDISGGPYHIKWIAADGVSVGNRDNQIMSSAILPPATSTITTSASASSSTIDNNVTIQDVATVSPALAQGTVSFQLFTDSQCTNAVAGYSSTKTVSGGTATSDPYTVTTPGTYYWIASFTSADSTLWSDVAGHCGDAGESVTIGKATPSISTTASSSVAVGGDVQDTATLTGAVNPTGTITFHLYSDSQCQNEITAAQSTKPVSGSGATSDPYTTTAAGTYYWIASYSGDANNEPVSARCGDAGESVTVVKATPSITTSATGTANVGDTIQDTATLHNAYNPTGTITFHLYSDDQCQNEIAAAQSTKPVSGSGATSDPYTTTTAGTYYWIASYSGDANNEPATGLCGDTGETSSPGRVTPTLTTSATGPVTVGGAISDTATLTGGFSPTGTITFHLYSDDRCQNEITAAQSTKSVSGSGATSDPYTPDTAGTYYWVATYSGDANNNPVDGACGDDGESSVVNPASPTITTTATAAVTVGSAISDMATLHGAFNPTGTITFHLYSDDQCLNEITAAQSTQSVSGSGATSDPYTPDTAGTYYWVASYSGDANNNPVDGTCGDDGETSAVNPANPQISTTATGSVTVGHSIQDTATLTGAVNPTGTITFRLYSDDQCQSEIAAALSTKPVSGSGATSDPYTPDAAGTYYWVASYSGDANNNPVSGSCADDGETSVVNPASPRISTTATGSVTVGHSIQDTATLTGAVNPTGTITFHLYSDANCRSEVAAATSTKVLSGAGATSDPFTPTTTGTYYWIASYSGDTNNKAVAGECGDQGETSVVTPATPTIATSATPTAGLAAPQLGGSPSVTIQDTATLSGATPNAGGTVTFAVFGPTATNAPSCTGTPLASSTKPVAAGQAVSDAVTITAPGWYWWTASYSGDGNNKAVAGACGDPNESTQVTQGSVGLTKTANPAPGSVVQPGQEIDYTVSVPNTGGAAVGATVVDTLPAYVVVDPVSISDGGTFSPGSDITVSAGTITWTGLNVPTGGTTNLTYVVHVSDLAPQGEVLTNLAQLGLLSASTTHQVAGGSLALAKAVASLAGDNVGSYTAGSAHNTLVYTLTGTASGDLVQHNVVITDYLPGYNPSDPASGLTTYVDGSATCSVAGCTASYDPSSHLLTWDVGTVAPGDVVTVTFRVTIDEPVFDETTGIPVEQIDNIGFIAAAGQDLTPSNPVQTPVTAVLGFKTSGGKIAKPPTHVLGQVEHRVLPFTGSQVPPLMASLTALMLIAVGAALAGVRRLNPPNG